MIAKRKNIILIILMLISVLSNLKAQTKEIDSLKSIIRSNADDSTRLEALSYLAWRYNSYNTDSALYYVYQQIGLSRKNNNILEEGRGYLNLLTTYNHKGYPLDSLVRTFKQGMKLVNAIASEPDKMQLTMRFYNQIGLVYKRFGEIDKAFAAHKKAIDIGESIGSSDRCAHLINLSAILRMKTDYQKALDYVLQAYHCAVEMNDERVTSAACDHIGYTFSMMNKKDSALVYYLKGLEIKRKRKDNKRIINTLGNIGALYRQQQHFEIANSYILEALDMAYELNQPRYLMDALGQVGQLRYDEKKYTEAIHYDKKAIAILGEDTDRELLLPTLNRLKNSYKQIGDYKQALAYQEQYNTIQDSIFTIEKEQQINELDAKYQISKKEHENQLLKAKQLADKKTIRSQRAITAAVFFAFLLVGSWSFVIYRSNQQKKKYNERLESTVAERTEALQIANKNLEQANYELRTFNYIASHDIKEPIRNIGNYAGLIFKKLPEEWKNNLGDYFSTIKRSTNQLYTLVEDFAKYTTLSKNEMIETNTVDLDFLVNSMNDSLHETIKKTNGKIISSTLPTISSNATLLYSIFKNLIENGLKFNEAPVPTIKISYTETNLYHEFIVSDNGIGIEETYRDKIFEMFKRLHHRGIYEGSGIGLAIVKLSVDKLQGKIWVEDGKEGGSQFVLQLPK